MIKVTKAMKPRKAAGFSEVFTKMIYAGGEIEFGVMTEFFQSLSDGE